MPLCRFVLSTLAISILVLTASCGQPAGEVSRSSQNNKLEIKYFYSVSGNRGYAPIQAGVEAAWAELSKQKDGDFDFKQYVELSGESDEDSPEKAEEAARRLRRDPYVLAVIGHPSSATTYAAMPFYSEAGIPVIIPNASSPDVLVKHPPGTRPSAMQVGRDSADHFSNAVRLIPADVPDQAHAMALTIKMLWKNQCEKSPHPDECKQTSDETKLRAGFKPKAAQVLLICDDTEETGAYIYSKPICEYLNKKENRSMGAGYPDYEVVDVTTVDKRSVESILPIVRAKNPDFIVVASYPLLAQVVLQVWSEDREKVAGEDKRTPKFIMPDACLATEIRDLVEKVNGSLVKAKLEPVEAYVTYPVTPKSLAEGCPNRKLFSDAINKQAYCQLRLHHSRCEGDEGNSADLNETAPENIPNQIPETAEGFAYDSVIILKDAVKSCVSENDLNRKCIRQYLYRNHAALKGHCQTYHVETGDRLNAHYFVYKAEPKADPKKAEWSTNWSANIDDYELSSNAGGQQLSSASNKH